MSQGEPVWKKELTTYRANYKDGEYVCLNRGRKVYSQSIVCRADIELMQLHLIVLAGIQFPKQFYDCEVVFKHISTLLVCELHAHLVWEMFGRYVSVRRYVPSIASLLKAKVATCASPDMLTECKKKAERSVDSMSSALEAFSYMGNDIVYWMRHQKPASHYLHI